MQTHLSALKFIVSPLFAAFFAVLGLMCYSQQGSAQGSESARSQKQHQGLSRAVFASGCFWCTEAVFERVEGVKEAVSGYAGGSTPNPTYRQVSVGATDYAEAVLVYYDSTQVSYQTLLDIFFHTHDPTQLNRQGPDVGRQYRSAIFFNSAYQQQLAREYIGNLEKRGAFSQPIVTLIEPLTKFWRAEAYHQDYYERHPDDPYIVAVSAPKVKKFEKDYKRYLKKRYQ
jgi:peptide-methionine (S)-S-oxide reductase